MSNFFKNFILDEEQREETFNIIDIGFLDSDMYPVLTCDEYDDIEAYYLFNRIKIWQKKMRKENKSSNFKIMKLLFCILLFLSIPLGIFYSLHEYKNYETNSNFAEHSIINFKQLTMKEKIKILIKGCL